MSAELAILITLILYKIVLVGFGVLARKRTQSGADFFLAGRGLGPVVAAVILTAALNSRRRIGTSSLTARRPPLPTISPITKTFIGNTLRCF